VNFGDYLQGSIELIAVAAAMGFAAVGLRGRLLPGWSGASARLAEVVLGLSLLVVILELVGVVGLYRPGWVLLAALLVGVGIGFALRPPVPGVALPAPAVLPIALGVAVATAFLVAVHWAMPTQTGLDIGMYLPNTTWHNAPFAARLVQDHQVGAIHFIDTLNLTVWFYPQNSELLHSAGVLFLGNDFLSPLINIGWMSLCLLAAWAFARVYGGGPVAVVAMALVLDANMLLLYQPGDAKNDVAGLFFLLASAAVLVNADAQRRAGGDGEAAGRSAGIPTGALVVAGLAAGLALGTKLNLLAPFGLLTLGVIAVSAGYRVLATVVWVLSSLVTGGFWFARNLVNAGNPLPWIKAGPLPGPDQADINIREPHNVAHYLLPPDGGTIRHHLVPGMHGSFGDLWPLVVAILIGGFLLAIINGRTPLIRMLGVVALLSGIAYLFTPLTAAGPEGDPTAFTTNLRYASPAFGLGAMLLAVDPGLGSRRRDQGWLLGLLAVLLLVQAVPIWDLSGHLWTRHFLLGGIGLAVFLILVPVGIALAGQRGASRAVLGGAVVLALALVVAIGWPKSDDYVKDRYQASTAPNDFPDGMKAALAWFNKANPHDTRIGVVGGRPGFKQYIFYGDDLSNHVQYIARHGSDGAYLPIASEAAQDDREPNWRQQCEEWRRAVNDGDYRYLVIGPDQRTQARLPIEAVWTVTDPAATKIESREDDFVFEINGELNPAGCAKLQGAGTGGGSLGGHTSSTLGVGPPQITRK